MSIRSGSTLVPLMGADGAIIAYRLRAPSVSGRLAVAAMAADGVGVALRVSPMTRRDQAGPAAMAADGVAVPLRGGRGPGMILVFTDEAESIYININDPARGLAAWDADVARWSSLVAANGPPECAAVHRVAGGGYDIVPPGRACPAPIEYRTISRNPSVDELTAACEACLAGSGRTRPGEVLICIDVSGSMDRRTMEPGIDPFEQWLTDGGTFTPDPAAPLPPIPWRETSFRSDRWLSHTCDLYSLYED